MKLVETAGFLVFFSPVVAAFAQGVSGPRSELILDFGGVSYRSVPAHELRDVEAADPDVVMGATAAKLRVEYGVVLGDGPGEEPGCLPVETVKISAGYPGFDIMIDERYAPGSCEYEAIAEHERSHVRIYRDELSYYSRLIEDELLVLRLNIFEVCAEGGARGEFREKAKTVLRDDERLGLLFRRMDESVREKNAEFDSVEEYLRVKDKCSGW